MMKNDKVDKDKPFIAHKIIYDYIGKHKYLYVYIDLSYRKFMHINLA